MVEMAKAGVDLFAREGEDMVYVPTHELDLPEAAVEFPHFFPPPIEVPEPSAYRDAFGPVPLAYFGPRYVHKKAVGGVSASCDWDAETSRVYTTGDDKPAFAIGVISALGNTERRSLLRRTWLRHPDLEGASYEYAFFVGESERVAK